MSEQPASELTSEHLLTLYHISGWINSTLDFDAALDNAIDAIMQVTKAQRGFLVIYNEEENTLQDLVARGIDGETIESETYSTTIVNEVVRTGQPISPTTPNMIHVSAQARVSSCAGYVPSCALPCSFRIA